jgi:hypothetical protein
VQERRAQRLGVEAHPGADPRDADRVDDEVLARLAPLVGVVLAGEDERVGDARTVDLDDRLLGVLEDDREEVGEQLLLGRGQLAVDRSQRRRIDGARRPGADADVAVDFRRRDDDRRRRVLSGRGRLRRRRAVAAALRFQAATARAALLPRYCRPSSSRR